MPKNDTGSGAYQGKTLWYVNWHDCGFMGFNTIWWGWGTGVTMNGITHIMAIADSAFYIGGSENHFFDGYSFVDNATAEWESSQALLPLANGKSSIGRIMLSARRNSYQLSIEGGRNLVVDGAAFDAPDSAPTSGKQIGISGGSGIRITNGSFKGGMANPAAASGGAAGNRALIHVTGVRRSSSTATTSFPTRPRLGRAERRREPDQVGLNGFPNNNAPQIRQSRAGQIVNIDPTVSVLTAP